MQRRREVKLVFVFFFFHSHPISSMSTADWKITAALKMGSIDDDNIVVDSRAVLTAPDMNYELRRLETFRFWPSDAAVDPSRIAKAGFYSTGNDLEVKCFSCGRCICEWDYNDQVMAKHRALNPECAFVRNPLECGNVPLLPPVGSQADYRKEAERLASFRSWPSTHVTPASLARNGLYYMREGDKVACAFCSVELHEWEAGDDPLQEHRRASPNCPLLFGYAVGNVPLDHTGSGIIASQDTADIPPRSSSSASSPGDNVEIRPFSCFEGTMASNKHLASNPQFGAQAHKPPNNPRYQTYEARLASFRSWPNDSPTPEALSDAGFYYQGTADHACCFHCNGGLHNWDPADDPWEEHARWFSRCPFVGIIKGREFIQQAISHKPPLIPIAQMNEILSNSENNLPNEGPQISVEAPDVPEVEDNEPPEGDDVVGLWEQLEQQYQQLQPQEPEVEAAVNGEDLAPTIENIPNHVTPAREPQAEEPPQTTVTAEPEQRREEKPALPPIENLVLSAPEKPKQPSKPDDLAEENRKLQEARLCKVCLDEDVGVVFLPCGHLITCVKCAPNLAHCPMCREKIQATVRTYFS
ncbi:hypothetical protein B566_EDAN004634 [Ephemera danica]|nr:hypothetical protein B566_EDAN004634 [Ephemera danica]